ncbi:hypothetical protein ACET3X_002235 [Alternaria dauci]|uniref:Uncharacterized protein n=1 Tax=Alternaria dauci TaxID=48095 RepID=A0ABR3UNZ9_9PLEO
MAPTPHRIAQTSTELKKLARKNGPRLSERQQKQLEREAELEQRAARARRAEESRKAAKKKREEREAKEARARQQIGVGLATQLAGYSHTQAQLKSGMEAFLGLSKKKEQEKREKDMQLTRKLEEIAEQMEKEPWDDSDDEDTVVDLPATNASSGEQWADDDLDDDTLLEAHDMVVSDPANEPKVSRELALEATPMVKEPARFATTALASTVDGIPPISTQDFDFSLDDLDEEPSKEDEKGKAALVTHVAPSTASLPLQAKSGNIRPGQRPTSLTLPSQPATPLVNLVSKVVKAETGPARSDAVVTQQESTPRAPANSSRALTTSRPPKKIAGKCLNPGPFAYGNLQEQLAKLRASQLPKSMTGPYAKRRATTTPSRDSAPPPAKKQCVPIPTPPPKPPVAAPRTSQCFEDFAMSTQEVASFFDDDDDDNTSFRSSPPIAV